MIVDTSANMLPIKATWAGKTIRFDLQARSFQGLVTELTKRCAPGFQLVNYIDDEGDAISLSSDEELAQAIKYKTGSALRLVLAGPEGTAPMRGPKNKGRKVKPCPEDRMRRWLQNQEPERHAQYEPLLKSLSDMGFSKFRGNLKVLRSQEGDLQKTIEILNGRKQKCEERLKLRELRKLENGQKRKRHSDKHDKKHRKRGRCDKNDNEGDSTFNQPGVVAGKPNFYDLANGFPVGKFTHLFVDGNNMFYLTDKLRKFTMRGKKRITEQVLSSVARFFAELFRLNVEIVYDAACSIPYGSDAAPLVHLDNGSTFTISSARPSYLTSDAKFVAWARAHPAEAPTTLVITSDRALTVELQSLGVSVSKPGMWLTCVAQTVGVPTENDWKGWLNAWIDKVIVEDAE